MKLDRPHPARRHMRGDAAPLVRPIRLFLCAKAYRHATLSARTLGSPLRRTPSLMLRRRQWKRATSMPDERGLQKTLGAVAAGLHCCAVDLAQTPRRVVPKTPVRRPISLTESVVMYSPLLVPLDGSPTSDRGLEEAVKLAKLTGARLRLVHVVDDLIYATGMDNVGAMTADLMALVRGDGERLQRRARRVSKQAESRSKPRCSTVSPDVSAIWWSPKRRSGPPT